MESTETLYYGLYRRTTAHWQGGSVTVLYKKERGQGTEQLYATVSEDTCVDLGDQFALTLEKIPTGSNPPIEEVPSLPVAPSQLPS
jgi:hypothetical protein